MFSFVSYFMIERLLKIVQNFDEFTKFVMIVYWSIGTGLAHQWKYGSF